jgi:hypothetical protein
VILRCCHEKMTPRSALDIGFTEAFRPTNNQGHPELQLIRIALFIATVLASSACASDPALRPLTYEGRSEAELVRDIGEPSLRKRVSDIKSTEHLGYCLSGRNLAWALEYHAPSSGPAYFLRKIIGAPPSVIVVVCVDASGKVTDTTWISIN